MDRMERKKIVVRSERTIKTKLMKDNVNNYRLGETAKEVKVKKVKGDHKKKIKYQIKKQKVKRKRR